MWAGTVPCKRWRERLRAFFPQVFPLGGKMRVIVLAAACMALCLPTWAADDVNPAEIIRKFAAKELEFQQARNNYTYRQSVKMEEVEGGGKWEEVDDIIFTPDGKRIEKVIYAPVISLRQISLSPEDVQDPVSYTHLRAHE